MAFSIAEIQADDLEELEAFARLAERELLQQFPALPAPEGDALRESFRRRMEHGSGVIARENADIVGCLATIGPIPDFRPGATGVYAPLLSCLAAEAETDRVFTTMLTELGNLPQYGEVGLAAITVPVGMPALEYSLAQNGFGTRCADAVVAISDVPETYPDSGFTFEQIHWRDAVALVEVKQSLARHLASSPSFMEYFNFTPEFVAWKSEQRESVHIAARHGDRIVGFIESTYEGENYLTRSPKMRNICGAGVLPEYRGRGIMRSLVAELANHYRGEGIEVLGVDYETFNPNARGFWQSLFRPYTQSWERRFDIAWGTM